MERITKPDGKYTSPANIKLKAYEDTGLDPKDILNARDLVKIACALRELNQYKELGDLDRLKELVEADKAGRLYKFRFGVGSTVYRVWVRPDGTHPFISEDKIECLRDMMRAELWVEPYSTREEAEAALEKMQGAAHE